MNMRYPIVVLICAASLGLSPAQEKQLAVKLAIQGQTEHPTVYLSKQDIVRARENRDRYPWAETAAKDLLAEADKWAGMSDDQLVKLIPPAKSCYAYGFSGCPVCGGKLAAWWGQGGVASLDDPAHIKCDNGHRLPDEAHPDAGEGWTDKDGKKFYFVGTYNSFVIDTLTTATTKLCLAYALSGEEKYALKAALILDHLARIYPTSETGSWDYPSTPPSGRFNRPWYQVARTLVFYANQYDILMMGEALKQPSSSPGMTRRENIEKNLLLNGAAYCYRQSVIHPALHNGQADYIRGPMAVGVAMGIPQYIAWGADGPYSVRVMIQNNVDRDGQYYETSSLYSNHARALYMDMAEILQRYTDAAHPDGIHLWRDPAFVSFNLLPRTRMDCAGLSPNLGDDAPNLKRAPTTRAADSYDLMMLERLRAMNRDPELAKKLDRTLVAASFGRVDEARSAHKDSDWLLFHAAAVPEETASTDATPLVHPLTNIAVTKSDLLSQKGLAILRAGDGPDARAATLRFGPTLNHGHLDEMNLNLYARGYEMSYDLGYNLGSTHTQVGWAHTTASHNLVLVDETPQLRSGRAGGTVERFLSRPGVSMVQTNDPACYQGQGVTRYARMVAMIDASPKLSYLVDIFHVEGGKKHDYIFHALSSDISTEGLKLGEAQAGSLAGKDIHWGDRIGVDGDVIGMPNKPYWNPPPGNGFGFLMNPRSAKTSDAWSATWTIDKKESARLRLTMLPIKDADVVTCEAPGLYPTMPKSAYVLARRNGEKLRSTFTSVIEPFGEQRAIRSITPLGGDGESVVAMKIELVDGSIHYVMWSEQPGKWSWKDGGRTIAFEGGFALQRSDGSRCEVPAANEMIGTIERVDYEACILYTKARLAEGNALSGQFLFVGNPAYAQDSAYRIDHVATDGDLTAIHLAPTRLTLGRGHLEVAPTDGKVLANIVPLEYAKSVGGKASGFFRGKRVTNGDGSAEGRIEQVAGDGLTITLDRPAGFAAGDDVVIYDVSAGDSLRVQTVSELPPTTAKTP
jgi:hypothetical protein